MVVYNKIYCSNSQQFFWLVAESAWLNYFVSSLSVQAVDVSVSCLMLEVLHCERCHKAVNSVEQTDGLKVTFHKRRHRRSKAEVEAERSKIDICCVQRSVNIFGGLLKYFCGVVCMRWHMILC